ncbi:MAG TPA: M48 family metalloprotease [Syntrophales bacterium]|nr:M48 family metalloprotease [Syntrophales bacterium]
MRKFLVIVLLVAGCATNKPYAIPPEINERNIRIIESVGRCIAPSQQYPVHIADSKSPNAWFDGDKFVITEGAFSFDDDALKFIVAHEFAHEKLGHLTKIKTVGYSTTAAMMVLNVFIPGAGLLNHAVNPAVTNNFNKPQELEADRLASSACECMGIPNERQIEILEGMKARMQEGGSFWAAHPSWDERIRNISNLNEK